MRTRSRPMSAMYFSGIVIDRGEGLGPIDRVALGCACIRLIATAVPRADAGIAAYSTTKRIGPAPATEASMPYASDPSREASVMRMRDSARDRNPFSMRAEQPSGTTNTVPASAASTAPSAGGQRASRARKQTSRKHPRGRHQYPGQLTSRGTSLPAWLSSPLPSRPVAFSWLQPSCAERPFSQPRSSARCGPMQRALPASAWPARAHR